MPTTTMKIPAVPTMVLSTASRSAVQLNDRRTSARRMARNAPTAPASVGVNRPTKMPLSTPTIKTGIGQTSRKAAIFASRVKRSATGGARAGRDRGPDDDHRREH